MSQVRHQRQLSDWLRCYNKSTTNRIQTPLLRFVVDSDLLYNKSTTSRHVEMLWICCRRSICRGFVVKLVVQQIHNKSNKWSLGIKVTNLPSRSTVTPLSERVIKSAISGFKTSSNPQCLSADEKHKVDRNIVCNLERSLGGIFASIK